MKADNIDVSYRYVKLSTSLFTFSIIWMMLIKPLIEKSSFRGLNDFFIGLPIIASGVISIIGFIYALIGSQYGQRNPKKRFFGLFGNFIFALILISAFVAIATDFGHLIPRAK